MVRKGWLGAWAVAVACMFAAPAEQSARAEIPPAETIGHDDAYWTSLAERLASSDGAVKDAAVKEVGQVPWQGRSQLQRLRDRLSDDQVKTVVSTRLEALGEAMTLDPPGISVDLKGASLADVLKALRTATGVNMTTWNTGDEGHGPRYTVKAQDRPFWEIFTALSAQHPLMIQWSDRLQIIQEDRGMLNGIPATNGFWVFPGKIERSKESLLQSAEGAEEGEEELSLEWTLAADPRTRIISYQRQVLTEVTDDAGNDLLVPTTSRKSSQTARGGEVLFRSSAKLLIPDNLGKKIKTVKGEAHFVLGVSESTLVVMKPEEKLGQPLTVGSQIITISAFEAKEGRITYKFEPQKRAGAAPRRGTVQPVVHMEILDKQDSTVWETDLAGVYGERSGQISTQQFIPPFSVRFTTPDKTKDVVVQFELKDLLLP